MIAILLNYLLKKNNSPTLKLLIRKAINTLNKIAINIILKNYKIKRLYKEFAKAKLLKCQKI